MAFANPEIESTCVGYKRYLSRFGPAAFKQLAEVFEINKTFGDDNWEQQIIARQRRGDCYAMVPYTIEDYNAHVCNMAVQPIAGHKTMPT